MTARTRSGARKKFFAVGRKEEQMVERLTDRQQEALDFIRAYTEDRGYPPTMRELADGLGLSGPKGAKEYMDIRERKGYIRREPESSRALTILDGGLDDRDAGPGVVSRLEGIPVVGRVAAGMPIPIWASTICRDAWPVPQVNELLLLARPFSPEEALALGVVREVLDGGAELLEAARTAAGAMALLGREQYAVTKRLLRADRIEHARGTIFEGLSMPVDEGSER